MSEERLIELETRAAYTEDLLQQLNEQVADQARRLDQLTAQHKRILELLSRVNVDTKDKPPHY